MIPNKPSEPTNQPYRFIEDQMDEALQFRSGFRLPGRVAWMIRGEDGCVLFGTPFNSYRRPKKAWENLGRLMMVNDG